MPGLADELKQVPLFSGLGQRQLRRLAEDFKQCAFEPGMTPLREGRMSGVGFYVIREGEASVSVGGKELARLGPGDHFGELGLISERARTATVTAETRLHCLKLADWDFRRFLKESPDVAWKLLEHVVGLLVDARERGSAASDG